MGTRVLAIPEAAAPLGPPSSTAFPSPRRGQIGGPKGAAAGHALGLMLPRAHKVKGHGDHGA